MSKPASRRATPTLERLRRATQALIGTGLVRGLAACEQLADRVAATGNTLGVIIGSDLVLAIWASLHGLAQLGRAWTSGGGAPTPQAGRTAFSRAA